MRKILVTGGTGLVGSHLLYHLLQKEAHITALRRSSSNPEMVRKIFSYYTADPDSLFRKITWVVADLLDPESVIESFRESECEEVFHCAAMVSFRASDHKKMISNNVTVTENIVNACRELGIRKMCYVSSTAALGSPSEGEEVTEESIWKPSSARSAYAFSKFRSEMEVWRGIEEGLQAVIVNPSIILGPGFWNKGSSSIFSAVYKGMKFYTNGITGYVDVRDVVQIMDLLMLSEIAGERFIVSSQNLSYRDIFTMIARELGKKPPRYYANPTMTYTAWIFSSILSRITSRDPLLTKEMLSSSRSIIMFSNQKIKERLGYQFIPIQETVHFIARKFLQDLPMNTDGKGKN
ncbi:MAG: NAD-dependent epimerase/dehydratase family protein [Bacteroidales bacterium]